MAAVRVRATVVLAAVLALILIVFAPAAPANSDLPSAAQASADWPMYGASADHVFASATTPPPRLGLVWSFSGNASLTATSAVEAAGFVYVTDVDTTPAPTGPHLVVHRLAEGNGSNAPSAGGWGTRVVVSGATAVGPSQSLAVAGGTVYVLFTVNTSAGNREVLAALEAATGRAAWSAPFEGTGLWPASAPTATRSAPVVAGGVVVFGSQDGFTYAVAANNGTLVWSFNTGRPIETAPAVFGSHVYVASGTALLALDLAGCKNEDQGVPDLGCTSASPTQGDVLFRVEAGVAIRASPVVADDFVFLDAGGDLRAINRTLGGSPLWNQTTPHDSSGSPAVAGNLIVARRTDGRVYAYQRSTGQIEWVRGALAAPAGGEDLAAAGGRLFLSARNGTSSDLVSLDATDGRVLDRNTTVGGRPSLGSPIAAGGKVIVAEGARLLAYRGQPDVTVVATDVAMSRGVASGNNVVANLSVAVRNVGDERAFGVSVRMYDGNPDQGGVLIGEFLVGFVEDGEEKPVNPGGRSEGNVTADRTWTIGLHQVHIVLTRAYPSIAAYGSNAPTEASTANNHIVVPIYVQPGPEQDISPGAQPYWIALLLGFLAGVAILYFPIRRLREMRRREAEETPKP